MAGSLEDPVPQVVPAAEVQMMERVESPTDSVPQVVPAAYAETKMIEWVETPKSSVPQVVPAAETKMIEWVETPKSSVPQVVPAAADLPGQQFGDHWSPGQAVFRLRLLVQLTLRVLR